MIPMNSNRFLSSNRLANGPIVPKQAAPIIPPIAIVIPKYLTVSSLDHPHISIANGVAIVAPSTKLKSVEKKIKRHPHVAMQFGYCLPFLFTGILELSNAYRMISFPSN